MKALVTGATGFVGSHLAERLCREGVEVVCLVRPTSRLEWLEGLPVEKVVGSLAEPEALPLGEVDWVFHVAAATRARPPAAYEAANVEPTRRLAEAAARANRGRLKRFVYVSSQAAVGPTPAEAPLDETAMPHPLPGYGASKLASERAVLAAAGRLPVCIVRPPSVYGPRDPNFISLFRTAQRLRLAPVVGSPSKQLSLVHVSDLVEGIWLAAQAEVAVGQTYFVGSGTHTWREIVAALGAALGLRLRILRLPGLVAWLVGEVGELKWTLTRKPQIVCRRKMRDARQRRWTCTWAKAERELGYRAKTGLAKGFKQTAEWYAGQGFLRPLRET
ncbi:MAG: NAD-dependent epimerase/dehydratase family protein [Planctomycetes bacterium]|nr:NAD-dependent epimerase/dehydratase family protein [Planctomycetota bacterium]